MEKLVGCIAGRGLHYLHLDKCLVPSIWTGRDEGKWIGGGGKSVDDEYSNLVGHCCLPFFSARLHTASNLPCIFVCVYVCEKERERERMCVICKKGQCSSPQYPSTFKGWILCPGISDTLFQPLQEGRLRQRQREREAFSLRGLALNIFGSTNTCWPTVVVLVKPIWKD